MHQTREKRDRGKVHIAEKSLGNYMKDQPMKTIYAVSRKPPINRCGVPESLKSG